MLGDTCAEPSTRPGVLGSGLSGRPDTRGNAWGLAGGTARGDAAETAFGRVGHSLRVRDRAGRDAEGSTVAVRPDVRGRPLVVGVLRVVRGVDARGHDAGPDGRVV